MSCNYSIENITNAISKLLEKGKEEDANKLYNLVSHNIQLSDNFQANPNSTSKLGSDLIATDIEKNRPILWLTKSVKAWVTKHGIMVNTDKFMNGLKSKQEGWQSALSLLYKVEQVYTKDKNGFKKSKPTSKYILDDNVAKAVGIVTADWVANTLEPMMTEHRSDEDVRRLLKLDKKDVITPEIRKAIKDVDTFYGNSVNELGNRIYRLLGIKAKKNTEHINNSRIEASLKTELGMLAIATLESRGLIDKVQEITYKNKDKEYKARVIRVAKNHRVKIDNYTTIGLKSGGNTYLFNNYSKGSLGKELSHINEVVEGSRAKHGVYTTKLLAVPTDEEIVNDGVTGEYLGDVVAQDTKDAVKEQSSTAYMFREGYKQALEILHRMVGNTDGSATLLDKILGYTDPTKTIDATVSSVAGKNRQIQETIGYLEDAYEDIGLGNKMYARWKAITNNRFMIDSNKLNWQDKKLHRYSVYHTASKVDTDTKVKLFHLMLAQAFDLPIDKRNATDILGDKGIQENSDIAKITNKISEYAKNASEYESNLEGYMKPINGISPYQEDIQEVMKYITSITDPKGIVETSLVGALNGEPEHLLSGVSELLQYLVAGDKYETTAMIETDAITSGYGIKNMQFPIMLDKKGNIDAESTLKELEKVGVFSEDSKYDSYGSRVNGDALDSYEEPAKELGDEMNKILPKKLPIAFLKLIDPKIKMNKDGTIKTFSRNFMKNPFMVLNYGSGISSITRGIAKEVTNNLYKLAQKYHNTKDKNILNDIKEIEQFIGIKGIAGRLRMNSKTFELKPYEINSLQRKILMNTKKGSPNTFGNALDKVFKAKYGHFIELTKLTNESLTAQFKVARKILDKRIRERYNTLFDKYKSKSLVPPITENEIKTIVQELASRFPVLKSALKTKDGEYAPILVAKKERVSFKDDEDAELLGNVTKYAMLRDKTIVGNNKITVAAYEVYKLIESYSSGAVIPIHFFDSAVQSKVLKAYKALGVHDANYFTLDDVIDGTKFYNENWYNLNKSYSLMDSLVDSFNNTFGDNNKDVQGAIFALSLEEENNKYDKEGNIEESFEDKVHNLSVSLLDAQRSVHEGRKFLYDQNLRIEHSYFPAVDGNSVAYYTKDANSEPTVGIEPIDIPTPIVSTKVDNPTNTEQQVDKPVNKKVSIQQKWYTREEVKNNPNKIYVFGDNTNDRTETKYVPKSTQALIRGLPNALGIDTRVSRSQDFTDKDLNKYTRYLSKVYDKLKALQGEGKEIVLPADGLATGKANLPIELYNKLASMLNKLSSNDSYMKYKTEDKSTDKISSLKEIKTKKQKEGSVIDNSDKAKIATTNSIDIWSTTKNGYESLSNLAYRPFTIQFKKKVIPFKSVEQAYQTMKSGRFSSATYNDSRWNEPLRKVAGKYNADTTDNKNIELMHLLMKTSFEQNPKALELLESTGNAKLTHEKGDRVWSKEFPRLLEQIREDLKDKEVVTKPVITLEPTSKSLLVPVKAPSSHKNKYIVDNRFTPKEEFHLTVFGFPQGKQIKEWLKVDTKEKMNKLQTLIDSADFSYKEKPGLIHIERDREALKDWKDPSKGKELLHEEALIQLVSAPGVKKFINKVNKEFGFNFPVPFPHISIAVKGTKFGIGIADEAAYKKLNPSPVLKDHSIESNEVVDTPLVNKPLQKTKADINTKMDKMEQERAIQKNATDLTVDENSNC